MIAGFSINMLTMFGMVLAVGILVDGGIVVVEYADRKMAEGMPKEQAFAAAGKRMFWPEAQTARPNRPRQSPKARAFAAPPAPSDRHG